MNIEVFVRNLKKYMYHDLYWQLRNYTLRHSQDWYIKQKIIGEKIYGSK